MSKSSKNPNLEELLRSVAAVEGRGRSNLIREIQDMVAAQRARRDARTADEIAFFDERGYVDDDLDEIPEPPDVDHWLTGAINALQTARQILLDFVITAVREDAEFEAVFDSKGLLPLNDEAFILMEVAQCAAFDFFEIILRLSVLSDPERRQEAMHIVREAVPSPPVPLRASSNSFDDIVYAYFDRDWSIVDLVGLYREKYGPAGSYIN